MNYIRHLNAFFSFVRNDKRLACSHVSLYLALFQYWNFNRFQNPFPVYRDNLMQLSKIGSKNTYHKCMKELHLHGYIIYNPPVTKFQPVKISMIRLDIKEEQSKYKQLDLFQPASGINSGTGSVPQLTATSTDFNTDTVSKMGQYIKDKDLLKESKHNTQKNFEENKSQKQTNFARVSNSVHDEIIGPGEEQVKEFFKQNNYPEEEALKFYNHYKSTGWKIKGITPITDWQASSHKWILNANKFETKKKQQQTFAQVIDINLLYHDFLQGHKIFHLITTQHFEELKLQLTEEIINQARKERIDQLTGSNQHSILQLLIAYQDNRVGDQLILKDYENLLALAKRITVIYYFHDNKQKGNTSLPP